MDKTYTKIKLVRGSDYESVGCWKPKGEKAPANLMASTMDFDLDLANLTPGKYRISFWKAKEKKTDKSPDGAFILEKVEETGGAAVAGGAEGDFNF